MLEEETFGEFYSKMSDLRNSMVSLGKPISDVKLIRKILRSLPERFRIKVTTIEESKDLEEMKIKELVGSLQTYELSLPPVKKLKTIALKASKKKVEASSEDDSEEEEKAVAMLAKNFRRLMKDDRFKKKFSERVKKSPREAEPEEEDKLNLRKKIMTWRMKMTDASQELKNWRMKMTVAWKRLIKCIRGMINTWKSSSV
jgi:hypothetical protein